MQLLILGGTRFVGRHFTEHALAEGHEVTLFNRNQAAPDLFSQVEVLTGDRLHDVSALKGRTWDAVIDISAYTPATARRTAELLQNAVQHYTFISTISVYREFARAEMDEGSPVGTISDEAVAVAENAERAGEEVDPEAYGPLKARCEEVVEALFPNRSLIVRPGIIVGPHDYTERFTYWVQRVGLAGRGRNNDVLAPGIPAQRVQFIDARDLAAWTLWATADRVTGTFNATGPNYVLTFGALLEACCQTLNKDANLIWVPNTFLLERNFEAGDLVPWHPVEAMPGWDGFFSIDVRKALGYGLSFRALGDTVQDTFVWDQARGGDELLNTSMTAEREEALLKEWLETKGG